jgi:glycosyltransferase involved in cell wall biosynthesis
MAKPRLLCVMQLPPPVHGVTAVNACVATSRELADRFELDVLPLQFADSVADLGRVSVRKVARGAAVAARLVWRLAAHRPAAVYLTLAPGGAAFYRDCAYLAIVRAFGARRILHLHARLAPSRLVPWALRDAWVIELGRDVHDARAGDDRVVVVPNGIADSGEPVRAVRATPRVLFLSNLARDKGPLVLADALALLAGRGVAFEATFAGAPADAGCAEELERRLRGLRARYIGAVHGDAKIALFRDHDVFALPTARDAFPLVVLEALQHGLPVVTTREGALPEIVDDAVGRLVPRDPAVLADALEPLLRDAELRARLGAAARRRYLERYTAERFERALASALAHCIADDAPHARQTIQRRPPRSTR